MTFNLELDWHAWGVGLLIGREGLVIFFGPLHGEMWWR